MPSNVLKLTQIQYAYFDEQEAKYANQPFHNDTSPDLEQRAQKQSQAKIE